VAAGDGGADDGADGKAADDSGGDAAAVAAGLGGIRDRRSDEGGCSQCDEGAFHRSSIQLMK
jgi:hypothetical protein